MIVTAQTSDEEIHKEAAAQAYAMGIKNMAQFLERLFRLERSAAIRAELDALGYPR